AGIPANGTPGDWQQFGYDPRHSGDAALETTLRPGNVGTLHLLYSVSLPGTVDDAPVYLSDVSTPGGVLDVLYVTTTDGQLVAVNAATGAILWSRQPATGPQYTTSAPAIDPSRRLVYSYGLEGEVHKYRVGDGSEVTGGGWPQLATLKPEVEKCSPALAVATARNGRSYLYVANGGYPGDAGDYQGHVTAVDLGSGAQRVWNADCSDQAVHFTLGNPDCPAVQTAVWQRGGVVYDSDLDRILFATGNGPFDVPQGMHDWGDSVLALRPDASGTGGGQPLDSYTPTTFQQLQDQDADLGSTAPAVLPAVPGSRFPHLAVQGGKDGMLRLLNLDNMSGQGQPGKVGGELQIIPVPQGGEVLTAIAVWTDPASGTPWIFVANDSGLAGIQVVASAGGTPALEPVWTDPNGGTSPVVADAVVFYVGGAGLRALSARHGALLWSDGGPASIHWQSPIVVDGRVYVADGNGKLWAYAPAAPSTCVADASTLCLQGGRFQVRAAWQTADGATGDGQAVALTADTGYFWFFGSANIEVVTKVLNGCGLGHHFWVFAGGLTNVHVVITVIDTANGAMRVYQNPQGTAFAPLQDTNAFDCGG
ncbi:MAG: PQQ-binding-like beta-propeller repeat protein, partial [Acidobacteria bacterium]|nr:PQQ-binding-like beta-propeller repeat protein [Acidobacteriota bacterium]